MIEKETVEALSMVPPRNSVFIVTCGHEGLSVSLHPWKAHADLFPQLSIYIGTVSRILSSSAYYALLS